MGYKPLLNLEKLGYLYYKLHLKLHNTNAEREKELDSFLFSNPNIIYKNKSIGNTDYEIDINVENPMKLRLLIKMIKDKFFDILQDYVILYYLKEHKYVLFPS